MISYFFWLYRRIEALRTVELETEDSQFLFAKDVQIIAEAGSKIRVRRGRVAIGYPLPGTIPYSSYMRSTIHLGKNSELLFDGPAVIAPGATIKVKDGAKLRIGGGNHIAHNFLAICSRFIEIGKYVALSWNVTLIDDDQHFFQNEKGEKIKGFYKPLIIERNASLQMNVMIPRGVSIGENAVVSCGTVVRQNIPANCISYQDSRLLIKEGIFSPAVTPCPNPA